MVEQRLHIRIRGASPYGFRLVGGRDQPVSVTKLRARSKAADAGLMEGDEVLAVNGYSCRDVSYERLIGLVEHAGHYLDLDIVRRAPNAGSSRDRKWSYDRVLDDVITPPTNFDHRRRMSSPVLDYDNVFDELYSAYAAFDRLPAARPALVERPAATVRKPWENISDDDVSVVWNPDKSITMSLALSDDAESKENRVPAQRQQQQQRHRNESFLMISSPTPPPQRVVAPSPSRSLTHQLWTPRPVTPPPLQRTEKSAADLWLSRPTPPPAGDLSQFGPLPPDVLKIISPPSDAESIDSLSPTHLAKRKKFADSSFFDDKTHNYPTVEEQMRMARAMAQSLTSPANQATRGHHMFMRRKEKSVNWTVDDTDRRRRSVDTQSEDLYYNPAPWTATTTWKPKAHEFPPVSLSPIPRLFAPRVPPASDEKANYMSADEFERMRLFEDKTTHDTVAPQLCFNLAADLRQSDSKGGRMFAKRRAKADQWTVGNDTLPDLHVKKSVNSPGFVAGRRSQEPDYDEVSWRQSETPELRRAAMSPWDAAAQFGHVEPAFEHLHQSSSSFIPGQPTSHHQHSNHMSTAAVDLSSSYNHLTSPVNGFNHISTDDDDDDERRMTSQRRHQHHHHQQQRFNSSTPPWQRDVSRTPNSVNGSFTYKPVHFNHAIN